MAMPDLPQVEIAIIEMTNAFRAQNRLAPLVQNDALTRTARAYATYLARTGKFDHKADGKGPADRAMLQGYKHCFVGENLALNLDSRGFHTTALAFEAVDGWKKSPSHRENMLVPHAVEIGVGVVQAPNQHPKFISVQLLGRPETMAFTFKIENRADVTVRYAFDKEPDVSEIGPRMQIEHQVCHPVDVVFDLAPRARYQAVDGATYTLTTRYGGGVRVDAMRPGGEPPLDQFSGKRQEQR